MYTTPTTLLDSSGNESDSSEELLYGPGFVSRLKSRYMSVALRGSTGLYGKSCNGTRKRPGLRRTASFEEFLEQEKKNAAATTASTTDTAAAKSEVSPTPKTATAATTNGTKLSSNKGMKKRIISSKLDQNS